MSVARIPTVTGLLLCEQIIVEEGTRNVTLVNCFSERAANHFPTEGMPFVVYALLTDGLGETPVEVQIHRLEDMDLLHQAHTSVSFASPLDTMRCILKFKKFVFPSPGEYQVSLLASGTILAQRRITLVVEESKP